jgi:predicted Fe-Mo cluster-binding NifX family protein
MKIAISATGPTLDADVDPRFGRCHYFIIADTETGSFEAMDNSSAMAAGGAGISAAQTIASKSVVAVLTGNCGPNAHHVFTAAGIKVITGVSGTIKDVIAEYKAGTYSASDQANVPDTSAWEADPVQGAAWVWAVAVVVEAWVEEAVVWAVVVVWEEEWDKKFKNNIGTPCNSISCPQCGAKMVRG